MLQIADVTLRPNSKVTHAYNLYTARNMNFSIISSARVLIFGTKIAYGVLITIKVSDYFYYLGVNGQGQICYNLSYNS